MAIGDRILLSILQDQVYDKFQISRKQFMLKLSFCPEHRKRKRPSYLNDDDDIEAFLLGRKGQTIKTTLQVLKELRVVLDDDVGSTREPINNFQPVENNSQFDNDNEDDDEDDDDEGDCNVEVADHDPLLERGGVLGRGWINAPECCK